MDGFPAAVLAEGGGRAGYGGYSGKSGSSPVPFDAVEGHSLAGPSGSHPLAALSIVELLTPRTDGLDGSIDIKHPIRIGDAIKGHLKVTATKDIAARGAILRLVGARFKAGCSRSCRSLRLRSPLRSRPDNRSRRIS